MTRTHISHACSILFATDVGRSEGIGSRCFGCDAFVELDFARVRVPMKTAIFSCVCVVLYGHCMPMVVTKQKCFLYQIQQPHDVLFSIVFVTALPGKPLLSVFDIVWESSAARTRFEDAGMIRARKHRACGRSRQRGLMSWS